MGNNYLPLAFQVGMLATGVGLFMVTKCFGKKDPNDIKNQAAKGVAVSTFGYLTTTVCVATARVIADNPNAMPKL